MSNELRNRLALVACVLCPGLMLGVFLAFPIWVPGWIAEFGISRGAVMVIYSASGLLITATMALVGRLLTRIPAWRLVVLGALILGGGVLLASAVKSYAVFAVVYALAIGPGVGLAGVLPCQALAAKLFPRQLGAIGGLMMVSMAGVGVVMPIVLTPLKAEIGWRMALAAAALVVMCLVLLMALLLMRRAVAVDAAGGDTEAAAGVHAGQAAVTPPRTGEILAAGRFWIIAIGILPLLAAPTAVQTNFLPILADKGVGANVASFVLAALAVGTAVGAVVFGWLADRVNPRLLLMAMAVIMAGSLAGFAGGGGLAVAVAAAVAMGVASGGAFPLTSIFAFQQFGAGYAPALGLLQFVMLPYMLVPPVIGWVRDHTGSYSLALLAMMPVLVLCAAVTWRLKRSVAQGRPGPLHAPAE